jgi:hypothetical protein
MKTLVLTALLAAVGCGGAPAEPVRVEVTWGMGGGLSCRDLPGQRVEIHAGDLGAVVHGPCAGTAELDLEVGLWGLRALLYNKSDQLLAIAETEVEVGESSAKARLVMQPIKGVRGAVWLRPHAAGISGCSVHNIASYKVHLARPWGIVETRRMPCEASGDLLIEHLLPGPWSLELEALGPSGIRHGRARLDVVLPAHGLLSGAPDQPLLVGLAERQVPPGRIEVLFARPDSPPADCAAVGVERLRLSIRRGGSDPVDFDFACGEPLPLWSELSDGSAAMSAAADGLLDERTLYQGAWEFNLSPAYRPPALILEPIP